MDARPPLLQVLQPLDGGVAQHVLWLALGLRERDWPVEVAAPPDCSVLAALEAGGVTVHRLPLSRSPAASDVATARALRALLSDGRHVLVHAHSSKAGALSRIAAGGRRPVVYTPHCFAFAASAFGPAARTVYRAVEQMLVYRTAAIVAVSEWEAQLARRSLKGVGGKVVAIPNGVRAPDTPPAPARDLVEFAAGAPVALFLSKLRAQKNPLALVRAAAHLNARAALPGRVAIVGEGELEGDVRHEIAARGLGRDVRLFPFAGAVHPYLAAADLLVLPSRWESLPISLIEAMASGLPVLATAVGGVPELVHDGVTGRLVPPDDEPALAAALATLLEDRDRRERMGAAARRLADERFALETMIEHTERLYERVLS
jgi:glycosyltransferase involved in cell wall biosynthesis